MDAPDRAPKPRSWSHALLNRPNKKQDRFREHVNRKFGLGLGNYHDLYQWSVEHYQKFWEEYLHFSKIVVSSGYTEIVENVPMNKVPRWFSGCRLNYAENLLESRPDSAPAVYAIDERLNAPKCITFGELRRDVARYASALRRAGVTAGDRVCGYVANTDRALAAYLATASLGAIWSSTGPDLGHRAVLDRFLQIRPKVVFAVDKQIYNKRVHDKLVNLKKILEPLKSVEKVIVFPFDESRCDISSIPNAVYVEDFLAETEDDDEPRYEQVPFSSPLCILFSSGTTGKPKCMVHSVGGTLIQHRKEHELHGDLGDRDTLFYYTTTGWMMWNWLVSGLAAGAAIVLYEGSPLLSEAPLLLFDMAARIRVTVFGVSAKYLAAVEERLGAAGAPGAKFDLSSVHTILSTGSSLMPHSFDYVYEHVKHDVLLGSISGGSDIVSCFVGQNCNLPVTRGEVQARNLGMDVQTFDSEGKPVQGVKGELVCCRPFPAMPVFFWGDDDGALYHKAYFERFPGVWHHGDFCLINPETGGVVMLGRSDATLNPNGVRFGSIEIYNVVDTITTVEDSVCVSYWSKRTGDEKVVLFVKLKNGFLLTEELRSEIGRAIREALSSRHVPALISQVDDIPYTINGKRVEVAVKKLINGDCQPDTTTLANPDCLQSYSKLLPKLSALD